MKKKTKQQKIKEGDYCLVIYQDAAYAYRLPKNRNTPFYPRASKSVGRVRKLCKEYLDLGMVWVHDSNIYKSGVVIPISAVRSIKKLSLYDKK